MSVSDKCGCKITTFFASMQIILDFFVKNILFPLHIPKKTSTFAAYYVLKLI